MMKFEVPDMTCGHCVRAITQAVQALDAGARVDVDLASKLVTVASASAGASAVGEAIAAAGYTPRAVPAAGGPVDGAASDGSGAAKAGGGCCCRG